MRKKHNQKCAAVYDTRQLPHRKKEDYERAIVDFTKAIEHNPEDVFAYTKSGRSLLQQRQISPSDR